MVTMKDSRESRLKADIVAVPFVHRVIEGYNEGF